MFIASYPRSGSAMVRMAMYHCFGEKTCSAYKETEVQQYYRDVVGHTHEKRGWMKTHRAPDAPCVVLVRDPRCVFLSLERFYRQRNQREYSIEQIIRGDHPWGDWSEWVRAWAVYAPRDALWIHYETFVPSMLRVINGMQLKNGERIKGFAQKARDTDMPDLAELRRREPTMFGTGDKNGQGKLPKHERLIYDLHGSTMTMLGYKR